AWPRAGGSRGFCLYGLGAVLDELCPLQEPRPDGPAAFSWVLQSGCQDVDREERKARGLGIDTLSMDHGLSRDFAVHHVVNGAGRYGLENVANLDRLPPRGFHVIIAPLKIETGSGGPARLLAVLAMP